MLRWILLLSVFLLVRNSFAFHIIGGEMIYDRLAGNSFRITLKLYRDCSNPEAAEFDDPLVIYVYNASGVLVDELELFFPGSDLIDPSIVNPCVEVSPDLCVQQAIYEGLINLPASPGGYDLVYQRCCRNITILNINTPGEAGATYSVHIPDPGEMINSSPRFTDLPPVAICAGYPFAFDHVATDPDGDELVYHFFTPFLGGSIAMPTPVPALPPPFSEVFFISPYSETYPVASSPAFTIDPATGWLAGTPTDLGQFVVGVAVEEYRAGVLIAMHYRDFQFNVTDCTPSIAAAAPAEINNCDDLTVLFENNSVGSDLFHWDFGVPGISSDTSNEEVPEYTYPDTGTYIVTLIAHPGFDCADTTFISVDVFPGFVADIDFNNVCAGAEVNFIDQSTSLYGTVTDWEWNYGDGWGSAEQNPDYIYEEAGNYMLIFTVTNSYGCVEQLYDTIQIYPNPHALIATDSACIETVGTISDASIVLLPNVITEWSWEMVPGTYFDTESFNWYFDSAGAYPVVLTVTTDKGCVDTMEDTIIVDPQVIAGLLEDTVICYGDTISMSSSGGIYYSWIPEEFALSPFDSATLLVSLVSGNIYVVVSDGCTDDTSSAHIEVLPAPPVIAGPDTTVYHWEPVELYAYGADSYSWSPETGLTDPFIANPVATPDQTTLYTVTGIGENGCSSTATALLQILPVCVKFETANAFSPNSDGINDRFRLVTTGDDALVSMVIYNRWGQLIFSTNSLEDGWDGTDGEGHMQEVGTYVYIIHTACDGITRQLNGSVTLLR